MVEHHSAIGVAAWTDLMRSLRDSTVSRLRGSPRLKHIGGKAYWYDHYRIGNETIDRYIGEDTDELRERLDRHAAIAEDDKAAQVRRSRLIRTLRAEGYLMADAGTGQIVTSLARVGVFRLGGTLVGTQAFRCYEGELGVRIGFDQSAVTDDIDIASFERLSLALRDQVDEHLAEMFSAMKFEPTPSLEPGRTWRWRQTERETQVEFLTPSFEADEGIRELPALGVSAQSLHFLDYLIARPIDAALLYRNGVLIRIPRPERYAIHKLIVADRRHGGPETLKSRKDRAQARFLIDILGEERPTELAEAYGAALASGPAWRERIAATLARMPQTRAILERLGG